MHMPMASIAAIAHPLLGQGCLHSLHMLLAKEAMPQIFCLYSE